MIDWTNIFGISVAGATVGSIVIYIGKLVLNKSSELILANHKNKLELSKIEHQVRFSKLHTDRGESIKSIYQNLYEIERRLKHMTSSAQGPEWKENRERETESEKQFAETLIHFEKSRIYLSEELCEKIGETFDLCKEIIIDMHSAKDEATWEKQGDYVQDGKRSIDYWRNARKKAEKDVVSSRLELAKVFREIIGVETST